MDDYTMMSMRITPIFLTLLLFYPHKTTPNLIAIPAFPLQPPTTRPCHLDLSNELFGGVTEACSHTLDRSRCCPVLAAWLYAAHARAALQLSPSPSPSPSPSTPDSQLPMLPESESLNCVSSLQTSLEKRNITLPQPNSTCDTVLCFCGIRLHQISSSFSCSAVFNRTGDHLNGTANHLNATTTTILTNLEKNCRNSSYNGCTKCLTSLLKLKGEGKNGTRKSGNSRASKMLDKDCQLMGLTWLLARNKTTYIPTVSAVLRAIMYSPHPHQFKCSPDQENMPLAVDSLQFDKSSSSPPSVFSQSLFFHPLFIIIFLLLL